MNSKDYLKYYIGQNCIVDSNEDPQLITAYMIYVQGRYTSIKPILKPLIDMEEKTAIELGFKGELDFLENAMNETDWTPKQFHTLISNGYDVFNLIPQHLAISKK